MKKKSEAQIYLEQVEKLDAQINMKLVEQQQWRDIALCITSNMSGERVQSSGSKSKTENAIARIVDIDAEIDSLVDKLIATKKEVIQTIEQLNSATEYSILHLRYIQYVPLKDIATMWKAEYTNITSAHGRALKKVQAILDSRK